MAERNATLENTIEALTRQKKYPALRDILVTMNPADIAVLFDGLEERTLPLLFRLLPKDLAAETFVEMEPEPQELLIRGFSDSELKEVVDELYVDDAVDLVEEMPANVVNRILRQADAETRKLINDILKYPEDSAGSIMTTEYIELRPSMTVSDAIKNIRRNGSDSETINTCYITDHPRHPSVRGRRSPVGHHGGARHQRLHPDRPGGGYVHDLQVQLHCPARGGR